DDENREVIYNSRAAMPQLTLIAGPTAVGKTALSLELVARLDAEILVADSRQVYRGMDLGTAKPTPVECAAIPHHGIDLCAPDHPFTVAEWVADAARAIADITGRGKRVLVVAGTGLYVKALTDGWDFGGVGVDEELRSELRAILQEYGLPALWSKLLIHDPAAADTIDSQNPARVLRALEIVLTTGQPLAALRGTAVSDYTIQGVVLTREKAELEARIVDRVDAMLADGWLEEVRALHALREWPSAAPALTGIGYAELAEVLRGARTLEAARKRIIIRTRQYAKRQLTWWRAQPYPFVALTCASDLSMLAESLADSWRTPS
ncbi:MAG: tRNA (adenosine(37)-N6)-dimethylallyltransferase MiaA, partial [bacterium]